jgi:rare lipoprotein A
MYKLTAAQRTLPFETMVRVTNVGNGKSTVVRITDRGPFVDNRIIDLPLAAAREIQTLDRVSCLSAWKCFARNRSYFRLFTVQVGAFRDREMPNGCGTAQRPYSPISSMILRGHFYRVRVGKISGEDAARQFGDQLHEREGFTPMVLRLDEGTPAGGNQ